MKTTPSRTLLIFYVLVTYVIIQLGWWAWLLADLNREIYLLKNELNLHTSSSPADAMQKGNELLSLLHKKWMMIVGEGFVFLTLLILGIAITRKSIKRERTFAEQQKNFLLSITHELRTPIASLKLQLETLEKRELDTEKKKELLLTCLQDTDRLNALVENILLATSIDQKAFTLDKKQIDFSAFVKEQSDRSTRILQPKQNVVLNLMSDVSLPIDQNVLSSIIHNLIENAVKYSPPDSNITINLQKANTAIEFSVIDEGEGIPDIEKTKIFERFYRAGSENTRKAKGTGLGLFIVKFLTEKHGGMISVRDNSPKGSIFTVRFTA